MTKQYTSWGWTDDEIEKEDIEQCFQCEHGLSHKECADEAEENAICYDCYALKGNYTFPSVALSQARKLAAIDKPLWVDVMVRVIAHYSPKLFRWHDSGDIQSLAHLERIVAVAQALPDTKFWLPTREVELLRSYKANRGEFPSNLCVRVSAYVIGSNPPVNGLDLPTSTVHSNPGEHPRGKGNIECSAYKRAGECGNCTACYDPRVRNVSYIQH